MRPESLAALIAADRRRVDAVLRVRHPRHDVVDGVRPDTEIAAVCRDAGAWLHVDGAMAGIAALVPEHRWVNDGLERPTATARTRTSGWGSTSTATCTGRLTVAPCSAP